MAPSLLPFVPSLGPKLDKNTLPIFCIVTASAFGYDSRTNDSKCKVLRIFRDRFSCGHAGNTPYDVEVYSLARGSWRILSPPLLAPPAVSIPGCPVLGKSNPCPRNIFVNGSMHWLLPHNKKLCEDSIVPFDMATESFDEIEIPEPLRNTRSLFLYGSVLLSIHMNSFVENLT